AGLSTGGMKSKLVAAQIATAAGMTMIIAPGAGEHPLKTLWEGGRATVFEASGTPASSRKKWIQAHLSTGGFLSVDDGAAKALKDGKSLLPAGVIDAGGAFERGDAVSVQDKSGRKLAIGLCAYSLEESLVIK